MQSSRPAAQIIRWAALRACLNSSFLRQALQSDPADYLGRRLRRHVLAESNHIRALPKRVAAVRSGRFRSHSSATLGRRDDVLLRQSSLRLKVAIIQVTRSSALAGDLEQSFNI